MPPVAPMARSEQILTPDYVRRNLGTSLAPLHFRNQLNLLRSDFAAFKSLAEDTWPKLQIRELEGHGRLPGEQLRLMVRDGSFVCDVASMGHGLQMWLQTMWFLSRVKPEATVILDEPDVFMHPDLQRRLIRYVKDRWAQVVIATHSIEIMSEVTPDDILIVDRARRRSRFATNDPAVQKIVDHLGSVHNIQLARLWNARKCVFVEGTDFSLLTMFYDVIFRDSPEGLATTPNVPVGGWGGFQHVISAALTLGKVGGEGIKLYCILDADYHTDRQKQERREKAAAAGVNLHIWSRKEIENFALVPPAIHRLICERISKGKTPPSIAAIEAKLDEIAEELRLDTIGNFMEEFHRDEKDKGPKSALQHSTALVEARWVTPEGRLATVSGKTVLSRMSQWSQQQVGVALSAGAIVRVMEGNEMTTEVVEVITAIANGADFNLV